MFNRLMLEIPTPAHYGEHVTIKTRERVRVVYEKLAGTDPLDNGMTKRNVVMARRWAAEHGWAPHWAWDDDTIEDPAAHPEWTGACGTRAGFRIHIRELMRGNDLPLCLACRVVFEDHRLGSERWRFNSQRFSDLLDAQPGSIKAFARALNLSGDRQVHAWRTGKQAPVYWSVIEDLAEELNCGMDDLVMEVTWEPLKKPRPIIPGDFNPYVVRVALDYGRTSQSKAADICNVSRDTMNNWLFARGCKPSSKERLVPLAQHLGIDVEVFYP